MEERELTFEAAAAAVVQFGKYRLRTLKEIFAVEPTYVEWLRELFRSRCERRQLPLCRAVNRFLREPSVQTALAGMKRRKVVRKCRASGALQVKREQAELWGGM